ncbi:MAG: sigma-70 family RNA polymerase sigma factor [Bacteroidales bacterium]|nr:sigma-70 family RNA polymerase sigma factor [Bacteroidales bacterium]
MCYSEEQIIEGCINNKRKAQKTLYSKYYRRMLGICLRYCSSKDEAEDVMLDGFMNIFSKMKLYNKRGSFEGWMKRVIVNTAIDNFRKNKKHYYHSDIDDFENELVIEANLLESFSAKEILNTVQQLSEGYRIVFNLFAIEGYSHQEIADMLGISINTSKTQLFKARKLLQKKLIEMNNE